MSHRLLPTKPHLYHGKPSTRNYFEGWYFKQTSNMHALSVIPGVYKGDTKEQDFAFIQGMNGIGKSFFATYPFKAFRYRTDRFEIEIDGNLFSYNGIKVDINQGGVQLRAALSFHDTTMLKTHIGSPSIMGPFSYLPRMQCNHGVLSLTHRVEGTVWHGDRQFDFRDGVGYIEKDWGEAFPRCWSWMQCNDHDSSMMCAFATIPFGPFQFKGLICVLLIHGRQYRFATYNGGYITNVTSKKDTVEVQIKRGRYRLKICAVNKAFGRLRAPSKTGMDRYINESIRAQCHVMLYNGSQCIFQRWYKNGGLEMDQTGRILDGSGHAAQSKSRRDEQNQLPDSR